jgi:sirohydrochlorin ferrochelatase
MALVLAVHGTRSPAGQATYVELARRVGDRVPVRLAHLDVQWPRLEDVAHPGDVVVPVLLARGHHVQVDCAAAAMRGAVVADAVGPDPQLIAVLDRRLDDAGAGRAWPVVLVAAGSRDATAQGDVRRAVELLSARRGTSVDLALASRAGDAEAVVARVRERTGGPVAVASWLVAPGRFASVAQACGADVVSSPLGACDALVDVVLDRYAAVARRLQPQPTA